MLRNLFKRTSHPLTDLCRQTSEDGIQAATMNLSPENDGKSAIVLSMLIAMAAHGFVKKSLQWDEQKGLWKGSKEYLRETNMDVITAETMIWLTFLMHQFWKTDKKIEPTIFKRFGLKTLTKTSELQIEAIKQKTGFDFSDRATQAGYRYIQTTNDGENISATFASVVLSSVGCRTIGEPRKEIRPIPPMEYTPLAANVGIFFATMPMAYYDTFKQILREYQEKFPIETA